MSDRVRVFVLCTGNSARSQMAEGYLNTLYPDKVEAVSAGSRPSGYVHPLSIQVMQEEDIDISENRSKNMTEFTGQQFDYVITVCDSAAEECPVFPGSNQMHWGFVDPAAAEGSEDEKLAVFRDIRNQIKAKFTTYFDEALTS